MSTLLFSYIISADFDAGNEECVEGTKKQPISSKQKKEATTPTVGGGYFCLAGGILWRYFHVCRRDVASTKLDFSALHTPDPGKGLYPDAFGPDALAAALEGFFYGNASPDQCGP